MHVPAEHARLVEIRLGPPLKSKEVKMPVHKVKGGWKYGQTGKVYKNKAGAVKQARAIIMSQKKAGKKVK